MDAFPAPLGQDPDAGDLRRQQSAFCVLTLFVMALLLLLHTLFDSILGEPPIRLIVLLGMGFTLKAAELMWLQGLDHPLTERTAKLENALSIVGVFAFTALLAYLTNRDDSPYFALLAIPILQCAYLCTLAATILVIVAADTMILFWLWYFFVLYPPARPSEYLEAAMISVIYTLMGLLVWFLVHQLKANQKSLSSSLFELRATREHLMAEEKLAAVGRLASSIAHEIRNPVAMIAGALSTAADLSTVPEERQEMFAIATRESERLEHLTADFLAYARPSVPRRSAVFLDELLGYICDVTTMHAARRSITITSIRTEPLAAEVDPSLIEGALLNLTLNAVDATPEKGIIRMNAAASEHLVTISVENSGPAIPAVDLERVFEPFFTTKPGGTGLGLAIARGVARAHGGDLWVSGNEDGRVTFTMTLAHSSGDLQAGAAHG